MKICIVANNAYGALKGGHFGHTGGVERQTSLLSEWLVKNNHEVSVITWDEGGESIEFINGVKVIKLCKQDAGLPVLRFFMPRWTSLNQALRQANADIYYHNCIEYITGQVALWCKLNRKVFVYATASDKDCSPKLLKNRPLREQYFFRYGLQLARLLIAQTFTQQRLLQESYALDSIVIPMPVTPPIDYSSDHAENEVFDQDKVIWVGRLCDVKRVDWFVDLAEALPSINFEIIGPIDPQNPDTDKILQKVEQLNNIVYRGKVDQQEMHEVYKHAALLCCTSIMEGFPNTFLEAWSYQTPIVTTFDPDCIVHNNELGISVNSQDELINAVRKIMSEHGLRKTMARNAWRYCREYHTQEAVMKTFEQTLLTYDKGSYTKQYFDHQSQSWATLYGKNQTSISHIDLRSRLDICKTLVDNLKLNSHSVTLDLGCGTGDAATILNHTHQFAVDFSPKMIEKVKSKYPKIETSVADAKHLPFNEDNFDLVIALGLFEYIQLPEEAIQEARRVLKQNGTLIMSIPNRHSLFRKLRKIECLITRPLKGLFAIKSGKKPENKPFHQQWTVEEFTQILNRNHLKVNNIQFCSYGFLNPKLSSLSLNIKLSHYLAQKAKTRPWLESWFAHTTVFCLSDSETKR